MINLIILEDEPAALNRLKRLIKELRPTYHIAGDADTVADGVKLLSTVDDISLILSDIQLADGLSFEIFEKCQVNCPIIFITAYNEYAIKAFDFNGIHYLMKPIKIEALNAALQKFETSPLHFKSVQQIHKLLENDGFKTGKRILSRIGSKTVVIEMDQIALVHSENKMNKVYTFDQKSYLVEYTLDELLHNLKDEPFFKISRQMIVNRKAVTGFKNHSSNRLILSLNIPFDHDIIVSKERSPKFKAWLM